MMPICFNVSVYQMDSKATKWWNPPSPVLWIQSSHKMMNGILIQVLEEIVVENPSSLSVTQKDVKAMQALKYTDLANVSGKDNADDNVSSTNEVQLYHLKMRQARKSN